MIAPVTFAIEPRCQQKMAVTQAVGHGYFYRKARMVSPCIAQCTLFNWIPSVILPESIE